MKKGIVCKIFKETESQEPRQVISLLIPTIIYIHKHFLHPSRSQTYYHPQARKQYKRYVKHVSYAQPQETWNIKTYQWEKKEHSRPHNQEKL